MVICLERGAYLHMAQLMPLPLTVSCFSKIQIGFPFWYRLSRVVPDKRPLNGCVHVCTNRHTDTRLTLYTMLRKVLAWWCNGQGVGLRHKRLQVRLPAVPLAGNKLGQVVHTRHVHLSPSRIIWYRSRGGDALWLGKSGGLASHWLCHRLEVVYPLQVHGLDREMSTLPTLSWPIYLYLR